MEKQNNWKKLLKADPTNWLLEPDDPGVRYLSLRDIVDADGKELDTMISPDVILDDGNPVWEGSPPVTTDKIQLNSNIHLPEKGALIR